MTATNWQDHTALKADGWFKQTGRFRVNVQVLYSHNTADVECGAAITINGTPSYVTYNVHPATLGWDALNIDYYVNISATTDVVTLSFFTTSGTMRIERIFMWIDRYPANYSLEQWIN